MNAFYQSDNQGENKLTKQKKKIDGNNKVNF